MDKMSVATQYKRVYVSLVLMTLFLMFIMGAVPACSALKEGGNDSQAVPTCIAGERRALLDIGKGIYDPDVWLSSWRNGGGDCCSWHGVACDNVTGHVTELHLQYPYDVDTGAPLQGASKLSPSLLDLTQLQYLDLSSNNFSGSSIPDFIGSLVNLWYLDLSYTWFHGAIPSQFGNLSNLQFLYIDYGYETAYFTLHSDDLHWLSRLTFLTRLDLSGTNLSKAVDWILDINLLPNLSHLILEYAALPTIPTTIPHVNNFSSLTLIDLYWNNFQTTFPSWLLNNVSNLVELDLAGCGFYGGLHLSSGRHVSNMQDLSLPHNRFDSEVLRDLDSLPNLQQLDLSWNSIEGPVPDSLWNLTHLKELHFFSNNLTGSLPQIFGNFTQLQQLDFGMNNFSGQIPESIGSLHSLETLDLSYNQISGRLPNNIGNLASLETLELSHNLFNGEIPPSLSNCSNLQSLAIANNMIDGEIPVALGDQHQLEYVDLSNNRLIGPMFYLNLSSLTYLDLSNNNLRGSLPSFHNKTSSLVLLNLSNNSLSGIVPNPFGHFPELQLLHLGENNLSGEIPSSLKHSRKLFTIDLNGNRFSGSIPAWIGESLSSLRILSLRSNRLSGHIPMQLSYLSYLQVLDLSQNNFTGNLSLLHFESFSAMVKRNHIADGAFFVFDNTLYPENIQLIIRGILLTYTDLLSAVAIIDLSSNNLSGVIPNGIMQLLGLIFLNLSKNHFMGDIPQSIGAMRQLEVLDLSGNNLSGRIPSSMLALNFLSSLNLSDNNLSGVIPSGDQFNSFADPSIYRGNVGLCGWPLPKCSSSVPSRSPPETDDEKSGNMEISIGAIVGFIVSCSSFFFILVIKGSVRRAYFQSIDKLQYLIYVKVAEW